VALDVVEQIIGVLRGEPAPYAVNAPLVAAETMAVLGPYLEVAEKTASLATQLCEGQLNRVDIEYLGEIANHDVTPLKAAVIKGLLAPVSEEPVTIDWIDERFPGLVEEISRSRGVGFVLARSSTGPICSHRGKRYLLNDTQAGPFTGREDLDLVLQGIRDLMEMPRAGDLIIYGIHAPEGDVSFVSEWGAHAGPSPDELHTFIIHPPGITLPSPITHPVQLYQHFITYQNTSRTAP